MPPNPSGSGMDGLGGTPIGPMRAGPAKAAREPLKIAIVEESRCAGVPGDMLAVPYGEFSAMLWGEFGKAGKFSARDAGYNQAALSLLARVAREGSRVVVFYGCPTEFQKVLADTPITVTITITQTSGKPCARVRASREPSKPNTICVTGPTGRIEYALAG